MIKEYNEKFKDGWVLLILRLVPNKWLFLPPEKVEEFTLNNLDGLNFIKFKEIRPLLKMAKVSANSDMNNANGLPVVTVFTHKDME